MTVTYSPHRRPYAPLQPIAKSGKPGRVTSSTPSLNRRRRRLYHFSIFSEASLKLIINGVLITAFSVALAQLLPQVWTNHQKRVAIEAELQETQDRVTQLEFAFERTFDPKAAEDIREESSYQVHPYKRRIVLTEPTD